MKIYRQDYYVSKMLCGLFGVFKVGDPIHPLAYGTTHEEADSYKQAKIRQERGAESEITRIEIAEMIEALNNK